MSRTTVTLAELGDFDEIIDVRSPAEYQEDRIPGAINCPVLDNEQRALIGTLYKQHSPFEARRLGGALVAENIAHHLKETLCDRPKNWRPLLYCWRGGMRSGSFATWMRLVGWQACQLEGGYKTWRQHVIDELVRLPAALDLRVICGPTGSAKTAVLQALAAQGAQVLDLEGLAAHKGSVLGGLPGQPQPAQKWFENLIEQALKCFDPARPVFVEAESRKIGALFIPEVLIERMRAALCIEIEASREARVEYLLRDYAWLGERPAELAQKLGFLKGLQANETLSRWQDWALARALPELYAELIDLHYDPLYARSQNRNFTRFPQAQRCKTNDLSTAGIEQLAASILKHSEHS
ncbi:tRNA 2-selenouridine(34) synthase MnmH [Uliginosibacterium aquaticum]|uniref:tRNA 2-selenouridine(34) synthase MnmH n=1 Tax=Uliginosibacterium aquaticum TaxID=2731212 RepID=A0ABX2IEU7_9RHOO|nr:tRNA 2-selenouridine(34) synthase MnmH [Uliginosibacterium aquaticum]NSL55128.1 tRNA 2-selenouridine(34) synthase MnmH [Uliginosibacterium aquaticum]